MTYKLKSGKEINTNEKPKNFIKKELNDNETRPRILKVMIEAGRPLRLFEIEKLSKMSKQKILNNLNIMISKGLILITEDINAKYYYPQPFFLDEGILNILYGIMLPFVEAVDKNTDYSQLKSDNREAVLENIQMLLKLFQFDIEDMKNNISECQVNIDFTPI